MKRDYIVRLGLDLRRGVQSFSVDEKTYNASEATDALRAALVEANGGETKFNWKTLRRNKVEIFEIIEELVPAIIQEGLTGNEFWNSHVDYKNLAEGDQNLFSVDDGSLFVVAEVADGIATPRRQRIGKSTDVSVTTTTHAIRIYEEFSRFMAGRIDWNELCNKVASSFQKAVWQDIYTAFSGVAATSKSAGANGALGTDYIPTAGTWDEDSFLDIIGHVEANTGKKPIVLGTAAALKKMTTAVIADSAKESLYNEGYYGKFYGYDVIKLAQAHTAGTDTFAIADDALYVVAGDDKFIKFVDEGEAIIDDRDFTNNADMTIEYRMIQKWGVAVVFAAKGFGKFTLSA